MRRFPNETAMLLTALLLLLVFSFPIGILWLPAVGLLAIAVWFARFAPARCLAENRRGGGRCRNNCKGWLGGCHLQSHQHQSIFKRLKPSVDFPDPSRWGKTQNWLNFTFGALSGLGGLASVLVWAGYSLAT